MIGIYKITNKLNGHIYIGLSKNIEERWKKHCQKYKNPNDKEYKKYLYRAFRKYGIDNFTFEVIEECEEKELCNREIYWISYYDSYANGYNETPGGEIICDGGENHPNHKLTEKDIINIRTYYKNKARKKDIYNLYKNKIGESGFSKIWKGETWQKIMPEVYTEENKKFHKNNTANTGSSNGRARLTEQDVKNIRLRRKKGENIRKVYEDYRDKITYGSFTNVWTYQNWKNIIV